MSTPTPAPALTDEQIDAPSINEIRADYVRAHTRNFDAYTVGRSLTSEQEVYGERFDRTIAAVVARAKREALRDVKQAVEDGFPPYGSELRFDGSEDRELAAYGSGMRDALSLALGTGGRI